MKIMGIVGYLACASVSFGQQGSLMSPGSPLPDVTAYDENGREFSLAELKGEYSVLVFGCLT